MNKFRDINFESVVVISFCFYYPCAIFCLATKSSFQNKLSVPPTIAANFFPSVYNKIIIWFGFCDNQGLSKGTSTFIFPDIKETFSDNCLIWGWTQPIAPRDRWRIIYLFRINLVVVQNLTTRQAQGFINFCYHSHAIHHGLGCEWPY